MDARDGVGAMRSVTLPTLFGSTYYLTIRPRTRIILQNIVPAENPHTPQVG